MAAKARTLDMSNVKERTFNTKHLPEGDYPAKVVKVEDHQSKAGNDQWLFTIQITEGPGKGASYPYYCGLDTDALWKVRNLMVACGINVAKSKLKVDPNKAVGRPVGITLADDEYNGREKSTIDNVIPISEVGDAPAGDADDDDVEEEEAPKAKDKKEKHGKKDKTEGKKKDKKKKEVSDGELEELEIEEM